MVVFAPRRTMVARHDPSTRRSSLNDDKCEHLAPIGRAPEGPMFIRKRNTDGFLMFLCNSTIAFLISLSRFLGPLGTPTSSPHAQGPPPWGLWTSQGAPPWGLWSSPMGIFASQDLARGLRAP